MSATEIPETATSSFGGSIWSDGNDLYIKRGKAVFGPDRIRAMSDHKGTKQELLEFWQRYLKDETLGEAVADWLMPPTDEEIEKAIEKAQEGPIKPEDRVGARLRADQCECWGSDNFGGPCLRCGHGLKCPNCCHNKETVPVVASAPVEIRAETSIIPMGGSPMTQAEFGDKVRKDHRAAEAEAGGKLRPVGACEHGTTEFFIAAEDEPAQLGTEIVRAQPPRTREIQLVRDWWDDPEVMDIVKNIVGRGATDTQVKYLIQFSKALGLNPLIGETRWNSFLGKPVIDRDGYVSHANRHPQFRGLISGIVYEGDEFEFDAMGRVDADGPRGIVTHKRLGAREPAKIQFAYAVVYRHDREFATYYEAGMKEFMPGYVDPSTLTYDQRKKQKFDAYPGDKLLAKAQRKAIARAFNLGALSEEDIRDGDTGE